MEARKDILSTLKVCRFCLSEDASLRGLYNEGGYQTNSINLPFKILSCLAVEVFPSDKMPCYICANCQNFMEIFYQFKQICRQADVNTMQYITKGSPLGTVTWPNNLIKLRKYLKKNVKELAGEVTTVDGTTVQVTSQDSDSEEDDNENVYDIKIGDGVDSSAKMARVKVITKDKTNVKEKSKRIPKAQINVEDNAVMTCKYCDKTFLKPQHYARHVRLKHRELARTTRAASETEQYPCDQCDDVFPTQDDLIYHSAVHATQNLTCPLCQEKFHDIDAVTTHIKSHVNGLEFMCDYCELVFISREKLDTHLASVHPQELQAEQSQEIDQEEWSMEKDDEEDDINVKEEDDHMVVEIKKTDNYMLPSPQNEEEKLVTNSEESETENNAVHEITNSAVIRKITKSDDNNVSAATAVLTLVPKTGVKKVDNQSSFILKKTEQINRKPSRQPNDEALTKKEKIVQPVNDNKGTNDKSLRLLEKELQELKRTTTKNDVGKTPLKPMDRRMRPQIHTSTPKIKTDEKKQPVSKSPAFEKKIPEKRIVTKENKEPKDPKANTTREDKDQAKEKEMKNGAKNGTNDKTSSEESIRRSNRSSKVKDYAKMIRSPIDADGDYSSEDDDEEYKETEKTEVRKPRKSIQKVAPKPTPNATPTVTRKRGRPRTREVPAKVQKSEEVEEKETEIKQEFESKEKEIEEPPRFKTPEPTESADMKSTLGEVLVSPSGQTLKKVPIKSLPPGVKPLPLPTAARQIGSAELCEMQIGKKVVKVQKIVMTKAEVEAMAKKGLVEMKDGTMVLKQGIKLPTAVDPSSLKSSLVAEAAKAPTIAKDKAAPSRCDIDEEA